MKKLLIIIILNSAFLILNSFSLAQNKNAYGERSRTIDSLQFLLKTTKEDTSKVNTLNLLAQNYLDRRNYSKCDSFARQAITLGEKLNYKIGIANSLNLIGVSNFKQNNYPDALKNHFASLKLREEIGNKKGIAVSYNKIGAIYREQGQYPIALEYYFKALRIHEELGDKSGIAHNLQNIGFLYDDQAEHTKALDCYFKALKISEELGDKSLIGSTLGFMGIAYADQAEVNPDPIQKEELFNKALDTYFKALKVAQELQNKQTITNNLGNIGGAYLMLSTSPLTPLSKNATGKETRRELQAKALDYFLKALKLDEKLRNTNGIAIWLGNIGSLFIATGNFKEAEQYVKKAIAIDSSIGTIDGLRIDEANLSQLYDTMGRYKEALIHYKKSIALKDTLFSQENKKQLVRKEMNYEFDKKEAITKAENEKQQAIAEEKSRKQKTILLLVLGSLILVITFAGFIFRSLRITRKQKHTIEIQKNEVSKQKDIADSQRIIAEELREVSEKQKHIVEEKQKEIVDSITYARRIQRALLTSDEYITNNLPAEHFILFKPKDIVSGDFYWAYKSPAPSPNGEGNKSAEVFYIATADCTGHGVPGAFMSMLNISYLNENVIERGIRMPHDILNAQRTEIIKALNPPGSTEVSKDGMDCILCAFDFNPPSPNGEGLGVRLHFAAANNPLWLVRSGELIEYKADKMPVGKYIEDMHPFTLQTIELQKGDIIYTSTDGFADQFGANGKKLMKKIFKEELLKIHHLPMTEQKKYLNKFFENWKGNTEQIDDVCVIGVKI